jgi:hypothetical protein
MILQGLTSLATSPGKIVFEILPKLWALQLTGLFLAECVSAGSPFPQSSCLSSTFTSTEFLLSSDEFRRICIKGSSPCKGIREAWEEGSQLGPQGAA